MTPLASNSRSAYANRVARFTSTLKGIDGDRTYHTVAIRMLIREARRVDLQSVPPSQRPHLDVKWKLLLAKVNESIENGEPLEVVRARLASIFPFHGVVPMDTQEQLARKKERLVRMAQHTPRCVLNVQEDRRLCGNTGVSS
eukprot:Sspe_Gene.71012::Locus_42000_Transcript_2_2_Confidence_0.750_Length_544::g.71012::m.71012